MADPELDARLAASCARALGNIRRARETILHQISQNAASGDSSGEFEKTARHRIEAAQRELDDLDRQEWVLKAELTRTIGTAPHREGAPNHQ